MADLLVSNLRAEIERTNSAFSRWTDSRLSWLHSTKSSYLRQEEECIVTINSLRGSDKQLDQFKKDNDSIRYQQQTEIDRHVKQIDKLESQAIILESQLQKFSDEESIELEKFKRAEKEFSEVKEKSDKSGIDLVKGVQLYMHLGLEFQKAPNECMKFIFTQIDPKNPLRQYYFSIFVDEHDKYQFVDSYPVLENSVIVKLVDRLNEDSDISRFVVHMRKYFCKTLVR